jgi:hypothetical protein
VSTCPVLATSAIAEIVAKFTNTERRDGGLCLQAQRPNYFHIYKGTISSSFVSIGKLLHGLQFEAFPEWIILYSR